MKPPSPDQQKPLSHSEMVEIEHDMARSREHVRRWYPRLPPNEAQLSTYTAPRYTCTNCEHSPLEHDRETGACLFSPGTHYTKAGYPHRWSRLSYELTLAEKP